MTPRTLNRKIVANALVAAIYFALTALCSSFSFLGVQFRLSEMLTLLCFFRPDFVWGFTIGCLLSNLLSPLGIYDVVFGTLATLGSCLLIAYGSPKYLLPTILYPAIINGVVVGLELFLLDGLPFWANAGTVAGGELAVLLLGYILFLCLRKSRSVVYAIQPSRHREWFHGREGDSLDETGV